jgi:streptomycin 6-kinase
MLAGVQITIPAALRDNVTAAWTGSGPRFLDALPDTIDTIARAWDLRVETAYPLSFHWVCRVTRGDGSPAVLKLGVPDGHLDGEALALRLWDGAGAVRLLDHDPVRGALLLEQAIPGTPVSALVPQDDEAATAALISAGRGLHRAASDPRLDRLEDEGVAFAEHLARFPGDDPLPRHMVERAARLFDELCASAPDRALLHGDLHHDNVLSADRQPWLAIDSKGITGDPAFDCGAMLYNPYPWIRDADLARVIPARVEQLADGFGFPIERVIAWGFVMAVLSEVWDANDEGPYAPAHAFAVAMTLLPRLD